MCLYYLYDFLYAVHTSKIHQYSSICFTAYCIDDRCSRYQPHSVLCLCVSMLLSPCSQAMNAQYIVTIKSITNIAVGIMVILQVQTSNTVLSATVVTQVLTVSVLM